MLCHRVGDATIHQPCCSGIAKPVSEVKTVTLCERDTTCCRIPHVVRLRMRERRENEAKGNRCLVEIATIINHVARGGVTVCRTREVVIRGNTYVKLRIEGKSMPGMYYRVCHHAVPS